MWVGFVTAMCAGSAAGDPIALCTRLSSRNALVVHSTIWRLTTVRQSQRGFDGIKQQHTCCCCRFGQQMIGYRLTVVSSLKAGWFSVWSRTCWYSAKK